MCGCSLRELAKTSQFIFHVLGKGVQVILICEHLIIISVIAQVDKEHLLNQL